MSDTGISLSADLSVDWVQRVDSRLARMNRLLTAPPQAPVLYTAQGSVVVPASGVGLVEIDGPDMGHYWYVRQIVVGGIDPTITALGVADIYVSHASLGSQPSLLDWRDRATRLPSLAWYGKGEMLMKAGQALTVRFTGATNLQQYVVAIRVEDVQESSATQAFSV